jgi:hypothetical protein
MPGGEIQSTETLYRRISPNFFDQASGLPSPLAYRPTATDIDGLSLTRASRKSASEASRSPRDESKKYLLSRLVVQRLLDIGLVLVVDENDDSHVLVVNMNSSNRKEPRCLEAQLALAEMDQVFDPAENVQERRTPEQSTSR